MLGSDSDSSDWDAEFTFNQKKGNEERDKDLVGQSLDSKSRVSTYKKITGVAARQGDEEDWDHCFDFDTDSNTNSNSLLKDSLKLSVSPQRSSTIKIKNKNLSTLRRHAFMDETRLLNSIQATVNKLVNGYSGHLNLLENDKKKEQLNLEDKDKLIKLIQIAQENTDYLEVGRLCVDLGSINSSCGFLVEAMNNFQTANDALDKLTKGQNEILLKARVQFQMALTAKAMQDILRACDLFTDALKIESTVGNKELSLQILFELAECYHQTNQIMKALDSHHQFLHLILSVPTWDSAQIEKIGISLLRIADSELPFENEFLIQSLNCAEELLRTKNPIWWKKATDKLQEISNVEQLSEKKKEDDSASDWDLELQIGPVKTGGNVGGSFLNSSKGKDSEESDWDKDLVAPSNANEEASDWDDVKPTKAAPFIGLFSDSDGISTQKYSLIPEKNYKTVKYPRPSLLYSLKTPEQHKLMSEVKLEQWLSNIVFKHREGLLKINTEFKKATLKELPVGSEKWFLMHLTYWKRLSLAKEPLWDNILSFFEQLHLFVKKDKKNTREKYCDLMIEALNVSCIAFTHQNIDQFKRIIQIFIEYDPKMTLYVRLMETSTYAHLQKKNKDNGHSPITDFHQIYKEAKKQSPNLPDMKYELCISEFEPHAIQAFALVQQHLFFIERSPLTTKPLKVDPELYESSTDQDEDLVNILCNDKHRLQLLQDLYPFLKKSTLKAKVAYSMALLMIELGDSQKAEELLFESIFILDTWQSQSKELSLLSMISEFSSSVLSLYGEVLLHNYKYKYAILAYEATLSIFSVFDDDEYVNMLQAVAKIAHHENDLKRAIDMFVEIFNRYTKSEKNRTNEIIYVSEILSSMYMELGEFSSAAKYLNIALKLFPQDDPNSKQQTSGKRKPIDTNFYKLKMILANVHLSSYNFEKGFKLLESLMYYQPPFEIKKNITHQLVKAYIKKGWYKEGLAALASFKTMIDEDVNTIITDTISFWRLTAKLYFNAEKFKESIYAVDRAIMLTSSDSFSTLGSLYYLRAKILQYLCKSPGALSFPTTLKPEREKSDYFEDELVSNLIYNSTMDLNYPLIKSVGDLLQECAETYKQASMYIEGTGDEVQLAKTMSGLAEMYLEYCFCPVVFYYLDWSDCARLPLFTPSFIAQNTREAENKKKEQQLKRKSEHQRRLANKRIEKRQRKNKAQPSTAPNSRISSENTLAPFNNVKSGSISPTKSKRPKPKKSSVDIKHNIVDHHASLLKPSKSQESLTKEKKGIMKEVGRPKSTTKLKEHSTLQSMGTSSSSTVNAPLLSLHVTSPRTPKNDKISSTTSDDYEDEDTIETLTIPSELEINTETKEKERDFEIKLEDIIQTTIEALDISTDFSNLFLTLKGYINIAEAKLLDGDPKLALSFWIEFRDRLYNLFMHGNQTILVDSPPGGLNNLFSLVERAVRFLLCQDDAFISENLKMIDVYLLLQTEVERSYRRGVDTNDQSKTASGKVTLDSMKKATRRVKSGVKSPNATISTSSEHLEVDTDKSKHGAILWGYLYYLKRQTLKYHEGKLNCEELHRNSQNCLRKMSQTADIIRSGAPITSTLREQEKLRTLKLQFNRNLNMNILPKSLSKSPTATSKSVSLLEDHKVDVFANSLYLLQIRDNIFYFSPKTGNVRVQRLGTKTIGHVKKPHQKQYHVSIHLMGAPQESVTLMISSNSTLDDVRRYVYDKYWKLSKTPVKQQDDYVITPGRLEKKIGFFSGFFSKQTFETEMDILAQQPIITELDKTNNFSIEFKKLVNFTRETTPKNSHQPVKEHQSSSLVSLNSFSTPEPKSPPLPRSVNRDSPRKKMVVDSSESDSSVWDDYFDKEKDKNAGKSLSLAHVPETPKAPSSLATPQITRKSSFKDISKDIRSSQIPSSFDPVEMIMLAKKKEGEFGNSPNIVPLKNRMNKKLHDIFPHEKTFKKNPINLFMYLSTEVSQKQKEEAVCFGEEVIKFVKNLIVPTPETCNLDLVRAELRKTFSLIPDVLLANPPTTDGWEILCKEDTHEEMDTLYLICSQSLQAIPWELIIFPNPFVVRAFTMGDLSEKQTKTSSTKYTKQKTLTEKVKEPKKQFNSIFSIGYHSQNNNEAQTVSHQLWVKQHTFHLLNLGKKATLDASISTSYPLLSPLVRHHNRISSYKRRFKMVHFFDYEEFTTPSEISKFLDYTIFGNNIVYLFLYADLLEMSECLIHLRSKCRTLLFIPQTKVKLVLSKLIKYQTNFNKLKVPKLTDYNSLISSIKMVQKELQIPICLFNPPKNSET